MYPFSLMNTSSMQLSGVEVGVHYYWNIGGVSVHGQVFIVIWFVIALLLGAALAGTSSTEQIPKGWQNFMESVLEFTQDIAKNQLGESLYRPWVPFISTLFLFIFGCNWAGALIPWKVLELPEGELAAPTNDINTTVALALLVSVFLLLTSLLAFHLTNDDLHSMNCNFLLLEQSLRQLVVLFLQIKIFYRFGLQYLQINLLHSVIVMFEQDLKYEFHLVLHKYMETFLDSIDLLCDRSVLQLQVIGLIEQ